MLALLSTAPWSYSWKITSARHSNPIIVQHYLCFFLLEKNKQKTQRFLCSKNIFFKSVFQELPGDSNICSVGSFFLTLKYKNDLSPKEKE